MLLSFENFGFKRKVESFPFWKTFHYENIAKVFRFGELSGNFKTTNCTIFFYRSHRNHRNHGMFFNKNRENPFFGLETLLEFFV
jgi:hypothetical protein